jgi:TP901 family phage tail tape measure protein
LADSSHNPQDNIDMKALRAELAQMAAELRKQGIVVEKAAQQEIAQTKLSAERTGTRAEAAVRRAATKGVSDPGKGTIAEVPENLEGRAAKVQANVQAEKSLAQAIRERNRAQREAERQSRLPVLHQGAIAGGTLGGGDPASVARAKQYAHDQAVQQQAALREYRSTYRALPSGAPQLLLGPGGGGGAQGPPRPPTAAGGADDPFSRSLRQASQETEAHAQKLAHLNEFYAKARSGALDASAAIQFEARAHSLAADATAKHGYLTSEFIQQALRGQVTFRQFGENVAGTIAKFAGWSAAAASVYGVLGALSALGRGALQAESGVGLVSRIITTGLDTSKLRQQFRDLSAAYNLPIQDVVQAVYGSAKVFNDQADAVKAAESALFAVKVGELSAAQATQYLTSIVNGFKLSAADLPNVFDAINQAQNKFGGNTGSIVAGVAKAAGAFKLAGGNYKELIALIETGTKLTGSTGENVGTAISRSASRVLTPQGAAALRSAGLTPGQSYVDILRQAFKASEGAAPEKINEIARALVPSGGQFARIFAPLLENQQTFDKILKEITTNSKGSSARELATAKGQPDEQIKALVNNAERLGSAFAQAGGLNGLGIVVKGLNETLTLTTKLVELIGKIPGIQVAAPFLELALVLKGLRRLDVGSSLPVGTGNNPAYTGLRQSLQRSPESRNNAQYQRDFDETGNLLRDEAQRARGAAVRDRLGLQRAGKAAAALPDTAPLAEREATEARYRSALARANESSAKALTIEQEIVALEVQRAEYDRLRKQGLSAELAAQRAGVAYKTDTLNRGVAAGTRGPQAVGDEVLGSRGLAAQRAYEEEARRNSLSRPARVVDTARTLPGRVDARLQGLAETGSTQIRGVERNLGRTGQALGNVGSSAITATRGVGALAGSIRAFAADANKSVGGLDKALLAIGASILTYNAVKKGLDAADKTSADLGSGTPGGLSRTAAYRTDNLRSNLPLIGRHGLFGSASGLLNNVADFATSPFGLGGNQQTADQIAEANAKNAQREQATIREAQKKGILLTQNKIFANLKQGTAAALSPQEQIKAIQDALAQEGSSYATSQYQTKSSLRAAAANTAKLKTQIAGIKADLGDLSAIATALQDADSIKGFAANLSLKVQDQGATPNLGNQTAALVRASIAQVGRDPSALADQLGIQQKAIQDLLSAGETTLNQALAVARSPASRRAARRDYLAEARRGLVGGQQKALADAQRQIDEAQAVLDPSSIRGQRDQPTAEARNQATQQLANARRARDEARRRLQAGRGQIGQITREQSDAQFAEDSKFYDARTQLAVARTGGDPTAALRIQLARQQENVKRVAKHFGKQSVEYIDALTQALNTQQQVVDAELATIESKAQLKASAENDPVASARDVLGGINQQLGSLSKRGQGDTDKYRQLLTQRNEQQKAIVQAQVQKYQTGQQVSTSQFDIGAGDEDKLKRAVSDAKNFLAFVQGHGGDPEAVNQAIISLNQARGALADYVQSNAQSLYDARTALALSLTEDPIKQAQINLKAAEHSLKVAKGPAERIRAQADVNNQRRNLRQTIQKTQFDNIEFDASIENIDRATEISRLQSLLGRIKGNKDLRRQIQQRIFQLKQEANSQASGFDLDVGQLKLPTIYDVRRAYAPIRGLARASSSIRGQAQQGGNTINIPVTVTDPNAADKVYDAIDRAMGTSVRAGMRSSGQR